MAPRVVNVVPHTHWDREWYLPFQSFRLRLVRLIDRVLEMLERDERFVFTLDGQLQTVDDYLEVRPEREERLRRLVREGRLAVGPWQVLMDEFLVSGETIWRNLERGLERGDELGGAMRIGYLPDMFGHVAQMPQILRAHGLDIAVVWRGVPAAIDRHEFEWVGVDGSSVRGEYLAGGYSNGAYLLAVPDRLGAAVDVLVDSMRPFFGDDPVLAMYGTDHMEPLPELVELVERANASNGHVELRLVTLGQVLRGRPGTTAPATRPVWTGEMRSGARANVLMGVTSARMDIKAAAARAERALERYAEPLAALHGETWPEEFLDVAWRRVIENSAHDSICGCSTDAVSAQVLVRYAEAEQLGLDLAREALAPAARETPRGAFVVANPSPFEREDVVELELAVPEEWEHVELELAAGDGAAPTQELERNVPHLHRASVLGGEIERLLERRLHGRELFGRWLNGFEIEPQVPRLVLELDKEQDPPWLDVDEVRRTILLAAQERPADEWEVVFRTRPRRKLLARLGAPPLGWAAALATRAAAPAAAADPLEHVDVAGDGTFAWAGVTGLGRVVRGKDVGDSYNYAPPPDDVLVETPDRVEVHVRERGPLRAVREILRTYRWDDRDVTVSTRLERRAGEPFLRVALAFDNPCVDQRVRVHLPLPARAETTFAEGQFAVVERTRSPEGGYGEVPLPTYPASSFVAAGGLAVLLEHVSEYELLDGELALTVLRSTGFISRNENPYREDPAGPEIPIPAAQMRGPWSFAFALYPCDGARPGPDVLAQAERYRLPFLALAGQRDGGSLREREGIRLAGDGVVLSSLRRRDGRLEARAVNATPEPRVAQVGSERVELRPWEIRTVAPP